jgi:hypothetical protein
MAKKDELLKIRFLLNMDRINRIVQLLCRSEDLTPTHVFQSEGVRGDMFRSVVVFLHATFEVALRSQVPKPGKRLSFYSSTDIDKALRLSGIDAQPFKPLYPPLTAMAKRRKQIVHEADLSKTTDTVSEPWGIADQWQLIMWLMAVPAFYYQLRISINAASEIDRSRYERFRTAMLSHIGFANQLLGFPEMPLELRKEGLEQILDTLESIAGTLST